MDEQIKTSVSKKWWVVGVIILILIIVVVNKNSSKLPEGGYKIGAVLALTGGNAAYGQSTKKGMDLAVEELNKDGENIKVVYEDEKSVTEGTVSSFQKLISVDNVPVVVGFISSNGALAAAPIANDKKVVELSTLSGGDELKEAGDYVFRIREKSAAHGEGMAKLAKDTLNFNKVALYYANAANGISYADAFRREFTTLGGTIVFEQKYMEKSNDFRSDLSKIKSSGAEAVYLAGTAVDMGQILFQANDMGITAKWLASAGAENPKLVEIAKKAADGVIYTTPAFNPNQTNSSVQKFVEAYKQKYNEAPNFVAANGYDGIMLTYQVIKKYGYDSESIKKGLYATKDFPGEGGTFSFDEFGEVQKPIMFKTVKDGQFVLYK